MNKNIDTFAKISSSRIGDFINVSATISFPEENECSGAVEISFHIFDTNLTIAELNEKIQFDAVKILKTVLSSLETESPAPDIQ